MPRRPSVSIQVSSPIAAASLAVGGAYLSIDLRVGIPLLAFGVVVTCWIAWRIFREGRARRVVGALMVAASRRVSECENTAGPLPVEDVVKLMNYEAAWVQAALGHMEARLLVDTNRQMLPSLAGLSSGRWRLRGFRANLDDLHKRLPQIEVEPDFKPREWRDRMDP